MIQIFFYHTKITPFPNTINPLKQKSQINEIDIHFRNSSEISGNILTKTLPDTAPLSESAICTRQD